MRQGAVPWITIHMAHSTEAAEAARELLEAEGFMVRLRPLAHSMSPGENCFEIMVLKSESAEARDLLIERGF